MSNNSQPRSAPLRELGVIACIGAAVWPLHQLVSGSASYAPLILVAGLIGLVGVATRVLRLSLPAATGSTFLAGIVAIAVTVVMRGGSLSPTGLSKLTDQATRTMENAAVPLPANIGVIATIALGAAALAIVIDYIAGQSRMPVLAVLPMAVPFVVISTALGHALAPRYFVVAALAWTLLALTTFAPVVALASKASGTARQVDTQDLSRNWAGAAAVTASAVVATLVALSVSSALPHRQTPAFSQNATQAVDTSVNFNESLDLSKDLQSTQEAPVLIYTTNATTPQPLRVTTSTTYKDGVWQPTTRSERTMPAQNDTALTTPGLDPKRVQTTQEEFSVTVNGMDAPLVASPGPLLAVHFGPQNAPVPFKLTINGNVPLLSKKADVYATQYRQFTADSKPTSNEAVTAATPTVTKEDLDLNQIPAQAQQRIKDLTSRATKGKTSRFEQAAAIQRMFRTDPSYTYSLKLAPRKTVNGQELDPLSNFLETKQGYCVQYASAMIMMARSLGIPARMAVGFLPGTEQAGRHFVHANDAHAWPELYFPGMGWTRFDPTPSSRSGSAPPYAPDVADDSASPEPTPSTSSSTSTSTSTPPTPSAPSTPAAQKDAPEDGSNVLATIVKVLSGLALVAALLSILPLAGRRERERLRRSAQTRAETAEGEWHDIAWRMRDLGLPLAAGLSPRATYERFAQDHPDLKSVLPPLRDATETLEEARYAPVTSRAPLASPQPVVNAAQDEVGTLRKVQALLFPASGVAFFRRLFGQNPQP